MKFWLVLHILGALCILCAFAMVPSILIASFETANPLIGTRTLWAFGISIVVSLAVGSALWLATRRSRGEHFTATEGFAIAALGWILFSMVGGLPLYTLSLDDEEYLSGGARNRDATQPSVNPVTNVEGYRVNVGLERTYGVTARYRF